MAADRDEPVSSEELIRRAREVQKSEQGSHPDRETPPAPSQPSEGTASTERLDAETHDREAGARDTAPDDAVVVDEPAAHPPWAPERSDQEPTLPPERPIDRPDPPWKRAWRWGRWVLLGVIAVNGVAGLLDSEQSIDSLDVGDCFMNEEVSVVAEVETVDCSESHDLELYARVEITGLGGAYPGDGRVVDWLDEACVSRFDAFVGRDYQSSAYWLLTYTPTAELWASGDRLGLCAVYIGDGDGNISRSTGSARNSGR